MVLTLASLALAMDGGPPPVVLEEERDRPASLGHGVSGWGVGLLLGLPTGLSAAYRPGGRVWIDGALAWSFERSTVDVHTDVLFTLAEPRTDDIPDVVFPVWIGVGPRVRLGDTPETPGSGWLTLGARVPIGMSFIHEALPLEGFLELAPGLGVYPTFFPLFDVAVGARYYFGKAARSEG